MTWLLSERKWLEFKAYINYTVFSAGDYYSKGFQV